MNQQSTSFLIVEDNPEIAQSNCKFLQVIVPDSYCIYCETPEQSKARLALSLPTLIIVDLQFKTESGFLSGKPGIDLLKTLFTNYPSLNILVHTSEPLLLSPLIDCINHHTGGFAVVDKTERREAFKAAAQCAMAGVLWLPKELRENLKFNEFELNILELICRQHLTDKALAKELNVTVRTAQNYVQRVKSKLGLDVYLDDKVNSRVALCMEATRKKLFNL